jgi:Zn-dependent M28 family amino/carboxypeptidase
VNQWGNDLAAEYIKSELSKYDLEIYDQRYSTQGRNIYAIQRGIKYPEKYFIYCAHYDAVTYYCADDNASGVALVLEAARILSDYQFDYSIVYALWDQEEEGKKGSQFYAAQADSNNMDIIGVINIDMVGWDSNDDGLLDIHTKYFANSVALSNFMVIIHSLYDFQLSPIIYNPGTHGSDHESFWFRDFSAVLLTEAYFGGDFNPYYHTQEDRIDKFNLNYFFEMTKLGLASIATLAKESFIVSVSDYDNKVFSFSVNNFPNPFNNSTTVQYSMSEQGIISLDLYNSIGKKIKNLDVGYKNRGKYEINLIADGISSGVYFIVLRSTNHTLCHKIVLLK